MERTLSFLFWKGIAKGKPFNINTHTNIYKVLILNLIMKTEEEIREKIQYAQSKKHDAKRRNDDAGLRAWLKVEKFLKWVLEDSEDKPNGT